MFAPALPGLLAAALFAALHVASGRRFGAGTFLLSLAAGLAISGGTALWLIDGKLEWNSVRGVIPVAITRDINPYALPGAGPLWCNIYPPGAFFLQTIIALAPTPQSAIHIGQALSTLAILLPLMALAHRVARERDLTGIVWVPVLLAGAAIACKPIADAALTVHVDGCAVGFALLAVALLGVTAPLRWEILLAGAACGAALCCKQTLVGVPFVVVPWLAFHLGKGSVLVFLAGLACELGVFAMVALLWFGFSPLWHCIVVVPAHHEFQSGVVGAVRWGAIYLWPILLAAIFGRLVSPRHRAFQLCLLIAAVEFPLSALGSMKFGGGPNNFAYCGAFVLAAWLVAVSLAAPWARRVFTLFSGLAAAVFLALPSTRADVAAPSPHAQSFAAIRAAPGRYYFPWYPLSHLVGENRITHFSWGVLDRYAAHEAITETWFKSGVPPRAQYLCFRTPPDKFDLPYHYLERDFPARVELPELPGWCCWERSVRATRP